MGRTPTAANSSTGHIEANVQLPPGPSNNIINTNEDPITPNGEFHTLSESQGTHRSDNHSRPTQEECTPNVSCQDHILLLQRGDNYNNEN